MSFKQYDRRPSFLDIELSNVIVKLPRNDGHTEKLEIREEGLGGVECETRESEEVLAKNLRKKWPV